MAEFHPVILDDKRPLMSNVHTSLKKHLFEHSIKEQLEVLHKMHLARTTKKGIMLFI